MRAMGSQITVVSIVCSSFCSDTDRRKHQSSASLAFVRGNHRSPVDSPHKDSETRKMFSFDDVIMLDIGIFSSHIHRQLLSTCSFQFINSSSPGQNGRHSTDDIFKCIFLNKNAWTSIEISLKFVPKGPINNIPALVPIMAWCRPGDKPLSEPMMVILQQGRVMKHLQKHNVNFAMPSSVTGRRWANCTLKMSNCTQITFNSFNHHWFR